MKRVLTVGMLIEALGKLPAEAQIWKSTWHGEVLLTGQEAGGKYGPLLVYEKDGETRLYIDDGEAYHGETELYWTNLAL